MSQVDGIRRLWPVMRDVSEISRIASPDRKTVGKRLQMMTFSPEAPAPRPKGQTKLNPPEDYIDYTLETATRIAQATPRHHQNLRRYAGVGLRSQLRHTSRRHPHPTSPPSATIARMYTPATYPAAPAQPETDAPLVSVMVPVYNVERYLPQCIDSILAQDYRNLDILLVDDGSTDGCGAMCDSYASRDPRVRVLHTQNHGLAAARNACLAHEQADLLLFVDADDWIEPNTVSVLVSAMQATGADIVCCRTVREGHDGSMYPKDKQPVRTFEGQGIAAELLRGTIGNSAWGKLCHAEVYSGITYPDGRVFEDIFTTHLLCKRASKVTCLPNTLFHYRIRSNGLSRTRSVPNLIDYWHAHSQRQADLQDYQDELGAILTRNRIFAAFRAWCWLATYPREERRAARAEHDAMRRYARESIGTVLRGKYSLKTRMECAICMMPLPKVRVPLNLLVHMRRMLRHERKPFE